MFPKYFTVPEASDCIPELAKIVRHLQSLLAEIEDKLRSLRAAKEQARRRGEQIDGSSFMQPEAELDFLKVLAQTQINRIKEMGAVLQDIHSGLVDFPMKLNQQDVMLCWQLGETEVKYYHGLGDGFIGRKPLPQPETDPESEARERDGKGDPGIH